MNVEERERLSKKIAGLLRHYGPKYGLHINTEGWADIDELVKVLNMIPQYGWVRKEHILEVVNKDMKGRYEIKNNLIRARYGHSLPVEIKYEEIMNPPPLLYHGTIRRKLKPIMTHGLLPMKRRYVHLSLSIEDAFETGRRHGPDVIILEIITDCLKKMGIPIYRASPKVFLVRKVPPQCIRIATI